MSSTGSHDQVRADRVPKAEHRTIRDRTNGRCRMWKRLGAAVVGAVSTTTLISASPAAAAAPHNLSKQDFYTFRSSTGATLTCQIDGFNVLFEDGDGGLSVFSS